MVILELKNVHYTHHNKYNTVKAVDGISVKFEKGRIYAVAGKSGSGKSTLLSLLSGLDVPDEGQVLYKGSSTAEMDLNEYRKSCAAVIYQDFKLFPLLTVLENIMYPMELCKMKESDAKAIAEELALKVGLSEPLFRRFPAMISGGEQQRVGIARALTMNRKLLIADEPTGNLDSETGKKIIDILVRLAHEEDCCVIVATHDTGIMRQTDKTYYIKDGRIEESPEPIEG